MLGWTRPGSTNRTITLFFLRATRWQVVKDLTLFSGVQDFEKAEARSGTQVIIARPALSFSGRS